MKEESFKLLRSVAEQTMTVQEAIAIPEGKILVEKHLLDESGLTEEGRKQLAPYQVDNAIIMAAGYSARCMPLSNVMPKGLFQVKGEILIEREIRQLLEAGIEEIIVVTGFMAEKFEYLKLVSTRIVLCGKSSGNLYGGGNTPFTDFTARILSNSS